MNCPFCGKNSSRVMESRDSSDGLRRRRECLVCDTRFTTYEKTHTLPLTVIKRNQSREPFSPEKLEKSLRIACAKRPVSNEELSDVILGIKRTLHELGNPDIKSNLIGEIVISKLKTLDSVAYIRFASVYKDFQGIDNFMEELETLTNEKDLGKIPVNQMNFIDSLEN